jgi:site-specific DNA-methyltransferase (adenine-specific)
VASDRRPGVIDSPDVQLARGDCIDWIGRLQAGIGPFQLIYVDPPFNAGGERRARKKTGERVHGSLAYHDAWGGLDAFLAMLVPRLALLREALASDGSLWLHLDHRAVHDVKVELDRIFGRAAFVGEVIWVPGNGGKRRAAPAVTHQTLLVYRKGARMVWNSDARELREPFAETSRRMHFTNTSPEGRSYRERHINGKTYRYYADRGRLIGSVWLDCPAMSANTPLRGETTGYPTQKPESLLRRIIVGATQPGAAVLDPMCGSGTTLAVAVALGRRAAGCDQSALACRLTRERIRKARPTAFR